MLKTNLLFLSSLFFVLIIILSAIVSGQVYGVDTPFFAYLKMAIAGKHDRFNFYAIPCWYLFLWYSSYEEGEKVKEKLRLKLQTLRGSHAQSELTSVRQKQITALHLSMLAKAVLVTGTAETLSVSLVLGDGTPFARTWIYSVGIVAALGLLLTAFAMFLTYTSNPYEV